MGHIISPISYRLYNTRYWNNLWYVSNNYSYSYLSLLDYSISNLIKFFLLSLLNGTYSGILFSNFRVFRSYDSVYNYLYVHDGFLDLNWHELKKKPFFYRLRGRCLYALKKRWFSEFFEYKNSKNKENHIKRLKLPKQLFNQTFRLLSKQELEKSKQFFKQKSKQKFEYKPRKFKYKYKYKPRRRFTQLPKRFHDKLRKRHSFIFKKLLFLFLKNKIIRPYWLYFKNIFFWFVQKYFLNVKNNSLFIIGLSKKHVNANIVCEYFYIRLKQYYTVFEIIRSVNYLLKGLFFKKIVKGYKITISGRFTRKQRATYSSKVFGTLANSSIKSRLDYSYTSLALKYSNCSIKIWINLSHRKLKKKVVFII